LDNRDHGNAGYSVCTNILAVSRAAAADAHCSAVMMDIDDDSSSRLPENDSRWRPPDSDHLRFWRPSDDAAAAAAASDDDGDILLPDAAVDDDAADEHKGDEEYHIRRRTVGV